MMPKFKLGKTLEWWVLVAIFAWSIIAPSVAFAEGASIRPTVKGEAEKAARIVKDHAKQR